MLKKFLIGTLALLALTVAVQASAFSGATLKKGSKGADVMQLQTIVGVTADGSFGPMTAAAVKAWQASHGLVADGVVGPKTQAAMVGAVVATPGCPAGAMFNSMTGAPCGTVSTTLPAGCTSTAGFSATTGAKCDGSTTGPVVTGPLTGGAGDITTSVTSTDVETDVTEGSSNVKVLGFKVQANGSDVNVSNLKLTLQNVSGGSTSTRLERYISEVSVWMNGTKVGSASAADFSKDGTLYTDNIALSSAVVREGLASKATFYVALTAVPNIDTADLTGDDWSMKLTSIRFTDATGAIVSGSPSTTTEATALNFMSLATSGDVKIVDSIDSSSPSAQNVQVSSTGSTSDVTLLAFKIKAQGTPITFDRMAFTLTGTGATPAEIASEIVLKQGSSNIGTMSAFTTNADYNVVLDNDLTIAEDATQTFTLVAKINKIAVGNFGQGDSLTASLASTPFPGTHEDSNGDTVTSITGSAVGNAQAFYSEGVNVVMGTPTYSNQVDASANILATTYVIPVSITSFGNTLYVGQTAQLAATATVSNAFALVFQNSSNPTLSDVTATGSYTFSTSDATLVTNGYRLDDGVTKHFTVTVNLTTPTTNSNNYRVALKQLRTFTDASLSTGATNNDLIPVEKYQTDYKFITS